MSESSDLLGAIEAEIELIDMFAGTQPNRELLMRCFREIEMLQTPLPSDLVKRLRAACIIARAAGLHATSDDCKQAADEIERLQRALEESQQSVEFYSAAAKQQTSDEPSDEPIAWTIPGDDNADVNGFIPACVAREGEFTKPLYARPAQPPSDVRGPYCPDTLSACVNMCQQACYRRVTSTKFARCSDCDTPLGCTAMSECCTNLRHTSEENAGE